MALFDTTEIPILADALDEEWVGPEVRIATSISHQEARDIWGSGWRRRWTFNLKALGSYANALVNFYVSKNGTARTFNFTPPQVPGGAAPSPVLCRFDSPLKLTRQTSDFWPAQQVSVIEVL